MDRSRLSNKMRTLGVALGACMTLIGFNAPQTAVAANTNTVANSLATPITGRQVQELWPIEVAVEIVRVQSTSRVTGQKARPMPMAEQVVVVPDGHLLQFSSVVDTPKGRRRFEFHVVPRHHPSSIELEWDLEVRQASFRKIGVGDYLLHRLRLGQELEHTEEHLKIARADIVTMPSNGLKERVELDGDVYEIRVFAQTTRG